MQQLSGLDATFLYLESPSAPMHIGGLQFYAPPQGGFSFECYRELIASRLHLSRIFRRRLIPVPLGLGRPYWAEDAHFNLDAHLDYQTLPRPGGWQELRKVAERYFSLPLDRERPLWSITFIDGLEGMDKLPAGSFAMLFKVHHAAVDGIGSLDLLTALWDPTPEVRHLPAAEPWRPEPPPGRLELLARSSLHAAASPLELLRVGSEMARAGLKVGKELLTRERLALRRPFAEPATRFNAPVSAQRVFDGVFLELDAIKEIKNAVPGATVNDVVLSICAGALRAYLERRAELPARPLRAMVPISVRGAGGGAGNQVSAMLVRLATDEPDPLVRLDRVHEAAVGNKEYARAVGANTLMDAAQIVPFSLALTAARLYSLLGAARFHRPLFNLIITNVPGPREPLYLGGARAIGTYGMAPLVDGLGLILVVTSYLDTLSIGALACRDLVPDIDRLTADLRASFTELHRAATAGATPAGGGRAGEAAPAAPRKKRKKRKKRAPRARRASATRSAPRA